MFWLFSLGHLQRKMKGFFVQSDTLLKKQNYDSYMFHLDGSSEAVILGDELVGRQIARFQLHFKFKMTRGSCQPSILLSSKLG